MRDDETGRDAVLGAEERHRTDEGEFPLRDETLQIDPDAGEAQAPHRVEESLQRDVGERELPRELLGHRQRRVLGRLLGGLDRLAAVLQLADVDLRLEGARVLVQQVAKVGQLVLADLDVGLDRADLEVALVDFSGDPIVLAPELRELLLRRRELLRERELLPGDLLAQLVERLDARGELLLGGARQSVHRLAGIRLLGTARDGETDDPKNAEGCFHRSFTGSGTKAGVCLPWRISSAVWTSPAMDFDGSHFQPSGVGRPMPASPPALT